MARVENEFDICREAIYSNDYYDLIVDYLGAYSIGEPVCIQSINDKYDIAYYSRKNIPPLNLQDYLYQAIPKCLALTDQSALEVSGILRLQNQTVLDLRGQGVLIGFVDTGIDYENRAFRNTDGSTRIVRIWDQTIEEGTPPGGFLYGAFYDESQINEALQSDAPKEVVPSTDTNGHGTFLAGVACGSEDATEDFSGAAPLASIAVVKCKEAKQNLRDFYFIPDDVPAFQENDVMAAMEWLNRYASFLRMPLIICIGMGTGMGNHAGEDPLSTLTDELGRRRQRAVIVSTGNEANQRHHYFQTGMTEGEVDTVEISVGSGITGFNMEFWASIPEIYSLTVISPSGERLPEVGDALSNHQVYTFLFENTTITVDYTIAGARLGGQLIYLRFEKPLAGIWTLRITARQVINGTFHCWFPISTFAWGEMFFLRSNPDTTILAPGMSQVAVTVGAYQTESGSVYPDSGRGYSTIGTVKPDILAPGVNVYGPELKGGYGTRTGTSVAAAVTAGGCAQIFQWGIVENNMLYLNSTDLSNLLIRGAVRSPDRTYPNPAYGYGLLDVYNSLNRLRLQ